MRHVLGGARWMVAWSGVALVAASCRAKAEPIADAASAVSGSNAGTDRCAALAGPLGAGFASVGDHPPPPGLRSASEWSHDPKAPPYVPEPKDWRTPPGVTFGVLGEPRVEGERIIIHGELVNAAATEQRLYMWEAGMGFFGANLGGNGVTRRPVDPARRFPEVYPATSLTILPAGARWVFELAVILPCYTYAPGQAATVFWNFNLADHASHGEIQVKLP